MPQISLVSLSFKFPYFGEWHHDLLFELWVFLLLAAQKLFESLLLTPFPLTALLFHFLPGPLWRCLSELPGWAFCITPLGWKAPLAPTALNKSDLTRACPCGCPSCSHTLALASGSCLLRTLGCCSSLCPCTGSSLGMQNPWSSCASGQLLLIEQRLAPFLWETKFSASSSSFPLSLDQILCSTYHTDA